MRRVWVSPTRSVGHVRAVPCGPASILLCLTLFVSACAELPAVGPTIGEVESNGASLSTDPYIIIDADKTVVRTLNSLKPVGFSAHFERAAPRPELRIAVGDTIQVNVMEQAPGGLFSPPTAPGQNGASPSFPTVMQPIQVGADGAIMVPFAGRIAAGGRTIESVRAEIESKLANKAIFPQVQVLIASPTGVSANSATVGGEVNRAGLFSLHPAGNRLLDLIAEAGGARYPGFETKVYVTRRGQRREASLQNVIENPKENIFIYPHDDIYLSRNERTFAVLGASTKVGRYGFETAHLNLAEAVAIGGGFADSTADPAGVFVFRYETPSLVKAMRPEAAVVQQAAIPVLYRLNLRGGDGYFLSIKFEIRDKDIVLLANSNGAQFQKLLNILESGANFALVTKGVAQQNSSVLTTISTTPTPPK